MREEERAGGGVGGGCDYRGGRMGRGVSPPLGACFFFFFLGGLGGVGVLGAVAMVVGVFFFFFLGGFFGEGGVRCPLRVEVIFKIMEPQPQDARVLGEPYSGTGHPHASREETLTVILSMNSPALDIYGSDGVGNIIVVSHTLSY